MAWEASNLGLPSMTRCSQVTSLRSWLLNTHTIQRGSAQRLQYFWTVMSSAMLFICMAPSPTSAITGRSELRPNGVGDRRSHRRHAARERRRLALLYSEVARIPVGARSAVAGDDGVGRQQGRHLPDDALRIDGIGVRLRAAFELLPPGGRVGLDRLRPFPIVLASDQRQQRFQGDSRVAVQVDVD